jgi:hypothetical protein
MQQFFDGGDRPRLYEAEQRAAGVQHGVQVIDQHVRSVFFSEYDLALKSECIDNAADELACPMLHNMFDVVTSGYKFACSRMGTSKGGGWDVDLRLFQSTANCLPSSVLDCPRSIMVLSHYESRPSDFPLLIWLFRMHAFVQLHRCDERLPLRDR